MTSPGPVMIGSYDPLVVAGSVLIAILASYAALDLAGRVTAARGRSRLWWLTSGAISMGIGIWSMHCLGMLALRLPVPVRYHWPTMLLSLLAGIFYSAVALFVVSRRVMGPIRALAGGIFMGGGLVTLHYAAMESMRLAGMCRYSPVLVTLSVVLAVAGSLVSLWLTFLFRVEIPGRRVRRAASALPMAAALAGMHYTAMAAASFTSATGVPDLAHAVRLATFRPDPEAITGIGAVSAIVLAIALVTSLVNRRRQQRTILDELFEQPPQAVALINAERRVVRVNREFTRIFGYTPQETVGRRLSELIIPDEFLDERLRYWDLAEHGQRVEAESVRRRKDGSRLHVSLVLAPFQLPAGEPSVYAIYVDITQRKLAEEALRASEERWRSIFADSAVGIALTDSNGVFTVTNRAFQHMLGYTDEELRGLSFMDITYDEDREVNRALGGGLPEAKEPQNHYEKRYRRKDGKPIWVRITLSLATEMEAAPPLVKVIAEDITGRKQAEERSLRGEAYLAESQRLSHVGSWAVSVSPRKMVFWSQESYRIFDFDPDRGIPPLQSAQDRVHPEDHPITDLAFEDAIREKKDIDCNFRIALPDGTLKYCHSIGHPVVNENGEVTEYIGTVMDVTESRRAEQELQHSFDQLRALAARLQSVREEERTRVARRVHDELGQALTAIKIDLAALILDLPGDPAPQRQRSQSILKLLDDTIQSVRGIATDLRPGILDDLGLVAAVEWAAEDFQARTGTNCEVSLPGVDIALDPERATAIFRILQETLTNVARHTNATRVDVRLTQENGDLILEVHDNGQGIGEEHLSESRSLGILGMRERALLLGGELTISGEPGKGTSVRVRIPRPNRKQPKSDK